MRPARSAVLVAALLLAGCGHPLLGAELEVAEVGITPAPIDFPAAVGLPPANLCDGSSSCLAVDVVYDLGEEVPLLDEEGVEVELRLAAMNLEVLSQSAPGLASLEAIRVLLLDPSGGSVVVASWTKPAGATPSRIHVAGNAGLDLAPYLTDGKVLARVEVEYTPGVPTGAFTAAVEAVFSVSVIVDYLKL